MQYGSNRCVSQANPKFNSIRHLSRDELLSAFPSLQIYIRSAFISQLEKLLLSKNKVNFS